MLNVYLLRHGQTSWNADGNRYCGRTDVALTDVGIAQAQQVRHQLRNVDLDAVYSSPLARAWHTARIAGGDREVVKDDRLIEVDFGEWEGLTREEFITKDPDSWHAWAENPEVARAGGTGETGRDIIIRVNDFFEEMRTRHAGGKILVVGHNGINRLYLAYKLGMKLRDYRRIVQENSAVTLFTLDENGELTLQLLNSKEP